MTKGYTPGLPGGSVGQVGTNDVIDQSEFGNESLTETLDYIDQILSAGYVNSVIAGNKISIDNTDPQNPIVNFDPSAPIGGGEWSV